jgi:hypothetical protein
VPSARRERPFDASSGDKRPGPPPSLDSSPLTAIGLQPLTIRDAPLLKEAFGCAGKRAWCYYVPYLLCYGASPKRGLFWARLDDALALLLARSQAAGVRLDLLFPLLPFASGALRTAVQLMNDHNGDREGRVLWADAEDADRLRAAGFRVEWKEDEYLYDPDALLSLRGGRLRTFRRHVKAFMSGFDFECEPYAARHRDPCLKLLRTWQNTQGRKHRYLLDVGYTKVALDLCGVLPEVDLFGEVVKVGGEVVAFGFAGEMTRDLANSLIAKADPRLPGLSHFLRWRMLHRLSDYRLVNDASDLGHPGLAQFKRSLRPVEMLPVFRAKQAE